MISLISPALIIALSCPLLLREASMHSRELSVQAAVDEQAAHLGHEAAEQLPVGGFFEYHRLAADGAAQLAGERRALGVAERYRAPHARADAIFGFVVKLAEGRDDRLDVIGTSVRGDKREKILRELRDLEPASELGRDAALGRRRHPRAREEGVQLGRARELGCDGVELAGDDADLIALAGKLEEGLPVGARDAGRGLHLVADPG